MVVQPGKESEWTMINLQIITFFETAGDVLNIETLSTLRRAGGIVTGDDSDHDHSAVTLHVLSQDCVAEGSPNL